MFTVIIGAHIWVNYKFHQLNLIYCMSGRGRSPEVSDEDLIRAVAQACELKGAPMVPTKEIVEFDNITIGQQTVKDRLATIADENRIYQIKVGKGYAWGVPEDEELGGQIDFSVINWEAIDPEDIPTHIVRQHPDHEVRTYWEKWEERANTLFLTTFFTFGVGAVVYYLDGQNAQLISSSPEIQVVGDLALITGFVSFVLGFGVIGFVKTGQALSHRGVTDLIRDIIERARSRISQGSPIKVHREGNSLEISWEN